jgi:hypothetical protein
VKGRVIGSLALVLAATLVLGWSNVTICPAAGLLGVPCPSCGLTRASVEVLKGDFHRAYELHAGVYVVWPYLILVFADWVGATRRRRSSANEPLDRWISLMGGVVLALLVALWGARLAGYFGGPVTVNRWF